MCICANVNHESMPLREQVTRHISSRESCFYAHFRFSRPITSPSSLISAVSGAAVRVIARVIICVTVGVAIGVAITVSVANAICMLIMNIDIVGPRLGE